MWKEKQGSTHWSYKFLEGKKKKRAMEVKERPMEKTGGCLLCTGHLVMTMITTMMMTWIIPQ